MPTVMILRVGFPEADGDAILGEGLDLETGERINFLVPPGQQLRVLSDVHRGVGSMLTLHSFDVVPWDAVLGVEWDDGA